MVVYGLWLILFQLFRLLWRLDSRFQNSLWIWKNSGPRAKRKPWSDSLRFCKSEAQSIRLLVIFLLQRELLGSVRIWPLALFLPELVSLKRKRWTREDWIQEVRDSCRNQGLIWPFRTWISEIIWREFYRHILDAYPRVCKNKPFKSDTDSVPWSYDQETFLKWCQGKTGYPIVDVSFKPLSLIYQAGMRQLNETGWMHNRLRMVVVRFL